MRTNTVHTVWIVKTHSSIYHYSTDALIGHKTRIEDAFDTYTEALDYIEREFLDYISEDFWTSIELDVTWDYVDDRTPHINGHTYSMYDLHANSYYVGPTPCQSLNCNNVVTDGAHDYCAECVWSANPPF